jgi:Tfp pilus assembly protein PilF
MWINRSLEFLWLMAVVLVPLVYFGRDSTLSEAAIAYIEVPKVALLRTLVALMVILGLIEWGIRSRFPPEVRAPREGGQFRISLLLTGLACWLRERPTRWIVLAVWFYLGTTIISTVLSASLKVSLWGEVPGQDGFAAYTVATYVALFGVIATYLKTVPQLWRLLGAIAAMGLLVTGYGVLQHYGYDFLDLTELSGGGDTGRVTSFMGNAVFSGAAMLIPLSVSLMLATISMERFGKAYWNSSRKGQRMRGLVVLALWVLVLTVQLLGITFTLSRGPWLGTGLALMGFVVLAAIFAGRRASGAAALNLGLSVALTLAVVQWLSPISIIVLTLIGLLALLVIWRPTGQLAFPVPRSLAAWPDFPSRRTILGQVAPSLGLLAVLAAVLILALLWFNDTNGIIGEESGAPTEMARRFESIKGEVVSGSFSGRGGVWRDSWRLIRDRPWIEFDQPSFGWAWPVFGYGPDLFRYTYLLVSTPRGVGLLPGEPDHAHNYLIHQAVEQGALGMLSSLGIVVIPFLVGGFLLIRKGGRYSRVHTLLLIGLLATLAGRFLEQMVGVARVSDLTVFWTILAIFVALPVISESAEAVPETGPRIRPGRRQERRGRTASRPSPAANAFDWRRILRLVMVAGIIAGIISLTWAKNLNYPRAAVIAASGVEQFRRGDRQAALVALERASALAPDVSSYYKYRASVYQAFLGLDYDREPREWECGLQPGQTAYETCLKEKAFQNQLAGVAQRPFDWRLRLALADSASNLDRKDEAIRLYQEVVSLVPASWPLLNLLAGAYVEGERPQEALAPLENSLALTGEDPRSSHALFILGVARLELGHLEDSAQALERSLELDGAGSYAQDARRALARVHAELGRPDQ